MKKLSLLLVLLLSGMVVAVLFLGASIMGREKPRDALLIYQRNGNTYSTYINELLNVTTGETRLLEHETGWMRDGRAYTIVDEGETLQLSILDVNTNVETLIDDKVLRDNCTRGFSFSPKGNYLVYRTGSVEDPTLNFYNLHDNTQYAMPSLSGEVYYAPRWSPDETYMILDQYNDEFPKRLLSTADGRELISIDGDYLVFSPDGGFLAYIDTLVHIYELKSGKITTLEATTDNLSWSPSGRYLVLRTYNDGLESYQLYDMQTQALTPLAFDEEVSFATWLADESAMLFHAGVKNGNFKQVLRYDVASGKTVILAQVTGGFDTWMPIDVNGDWLAIPYIEASASKNGLKKVMLYHKDTATMFTPVVNDWYPWDIARVFTWSPDGRWLSLNATDGLYVFDTTTETLEKLIEASGEELNLRNPYWSPDSQYLSFIQDSQLKIWSAKTGQITEMTKDVASFFSWQFGIEQPVYWGCYDGNA